VTDRRSILAPDADLPPTEALGESDVADDDHPLTVFGQWLGERLREEGLSQTEAARRIGVTFRTLHRWVKGQSEPKLSQLRQVCRVLGTPPIC